MKLATPGGSRRTSRTNLHLQIAYIGLAAAAAAEEMSNSALEIYGVGPTGTIGNTNSKPLAAAAALVELTDTAKTGPGKKRERITATSTNFKMGAARPAAMTTGKNIGPTADGTDKLAGNKGDARLKASKGSGPNASADGTDKFNVYKSAASGRNKQLGKQSGSHATAGGTRPH